MTTDVPEALAGRYATTAVESTVRDAARDVVGNVGLLDLDGVGFKEAGMAAERVGGPAAVLRSSTASYHVWGLEVRTLSAWVDAAVSLDVVDDEHIALSERRECSVVRVDAKVAVETGETIAEPPVLLGVVEAPTDAPVSEPHLRLLVEEFGADVDGDDYDLVGHSAPRRSYLGRLRGDDS